MGYQCHYIITYLPTKMLLFAPIVTVMALYIAMSYTYMYLLFDPEKTRGMHIETSG